MKLKLSCPEGWTYVSWQRCVLYHDTMVRGVPKRFSNNMLAANALKQASIAAYPSHEGANQIPNCFFVQSGESATLEGLAEALSELLGVEIEVIE